MITNIKYSNLLDKLTIPEIIRYYSDENIFISSVKENTEVFSFCDEFEIK